MKQIVTTLLCLVSLACVAQEETPKKLSKIEEMSALNGTVIKKEFYLLGTIAKIEFNVLTVSDQINKTSFKGIKLEWKSVGLGGRIETHTAFLDANEVEGMASAMNMMGTLADHPAEYTEYVYRNKSENIEVFCYHSKNKWEYGIKASRYPSNTVFLEQIDFLKITKLLRDAIEKVK